MEMSLGDLLEELDKVFPNNTTIGQLITKGFSKKLIIESIDKGLVDYPHDMQNYGLDKAINDNSMFVLLTSNGFLTLNQIRIKRAINELNVAIERFDNSSKRSAKIMIWLTITLLILTGVIAWLTYKLV